jgi:hypothetical protein
MTGLLSIFRRGGAAQAATSAPALPGGPRLPRGAVAVPTLPTLPSAVPLPPPRVSRPAASATPESGEQRRLLIGFDATASREPTWKEASRLMDTLLSTLPGKLELSLAAHGGGRLHTLTRYTTDAAKLRDKAGGVRCQGGYTRLLDILDHPAAFKADLLLYIGDMFEESARRAGKAADKLAKCGTRVIILQEGDDDDARRVFADIAERTGGALLPFDISSFDRIGKELVELIAVLAVEGVEAVEAKAATMPAATSLLLQNLDPKRLLIGHTKG